MSFFPYLILLLLVLPFGRRLLCVSFPSLSIGSRSYFEGGSTIATLVAKYIRKLTYFDMYSSLVRVYAVCIASIRKKSLVYIFAACYISLTGIRNFLYTK